MYGVHVNATNAHEILSDDAAGFVPSSYPTHTVFRILCVVVYFYGFNYFLFGSMYP